MCGLGSARMADGCGGEERPRPSGGDTDGGPIPEPPGDVSAPQVLSAEALQGVRAELAQRGEPDAELDACLALALEQFCREPPCVQEDARLEICWGGGSLAFLAGAGACELSVRCRDGRPCYEVGELPLAAELARVRAGLVPLSADTLLTLLENLWDSELSEDPLTLCVCHAWNEFALEPECVWANARLRIQCGPELLEFVSGEGLCEVLVPMGEEGPDYCITELGPDRPVTWSHTCPEPLSVDHLEIVRFRLGRWGVVCEELSGCFEEAIARFSREPVCVQENARLRMCGDGSTLEFLSGEGACEINVSYKEGRPHYEVGELPLHLRLAQLHPSTDPPSTGPRDAV